MFHSFLPGLLRGGFVGGALQGLTLLHISAQPEHFISDVVVGTVNKTAEVELISGRVLGVSSCR